MTDPETKQDSPAEERAESAAERANDRDDDELLRRIRDDYRYASDAWREAREHRRKLMRYLCGDPWEERDRKAREEAGRPCISHDELNQYVFQVINAARKSKRGIKIEPEGNGASDKSAELREDIARTIEYKSQAQATYLRAYQDEVEGAYGFCRVSRRYLNDDTDEQEIVIKPIPNPDAVLYDPDCKEPDWSDASFVFVLEPITRDEFKRRFPGAKVQDFSNEDMRVAADWINEKTVLVAEYWKLERSAAKGRTGRKIEKKTVIQYLTNGIEILEANPQPGKEIPIPAFIGLERYVDDGGGPKRKLFALPSFALDPQMSHAYLCSQEMEEAGLTPKSPYVGYVGQFETDSDAWKTATKQPHSFLQADPVVDGATGAVLPLPRRETFTPNFGAYEVAKESARRAIQAAMGISPLPTSAQRQNEKSGVALQRIQAEQEVGSFHFVDGFNRAIARVGRIINSWIPVVYDTEREMGLRKNDDTRRMVRVNTDEPYIDEKTQQPEHFQVGEGDHDVTIGTGPSADSQRDAASDFLDLLVAELASLPLAPPQKAKLLALAIQMKQLGPKGDEMASIISPDDNEAIPPGAQQMLGQAKQQLGQLHAYAQQLEAKVQELTQKEQAKVIDNQFRMDIEKLKIEADLAKAEITTKAQSILEREKFLQDAWAQLHSQAHDVALAAAGQVHAQQNVAQQQAAAEAQQAPPDASQPQQAA